MNPLRDGPARLAATSVFQQPAAFVRSRRRTATRPTSPRAIRVAYDLPKDFMYLPDFRKPILEAFFLTASVGRPSSDATSAVARFGKSLRSCLRSSFDHVPLTSFFLAISRLLSQEGLHTSGQT